MLQNMSKLSTVFMYYVGSVTLLLAFSIFRLLKRFPFAQPIVYELFNKMATIKLRREDFAHTLFTRPMFESMRSSILLELQKRAQVGNLAPDSLVLSVDGKSSYQLLDFCKGNRPLVINFCSWTCPVFRARVGEYLSVVREFSDVADFLTVYIEEAHPSDAWAFENNVSIKIHRTLEERCKAAQMMIDSTAFQCPVVVDNMQDTANKAYAGMPIRLYILKGREVEYAGGIGPTFYRLDEVTEWLQRNKMALLRNNRHRA